MRGVQCTGQAFAEVNAEAVCDRVHARVAHHDVVATLGKMSAVGMCDGSAEPDGDGSALRDRGYSGPWHAYVRRRTFGTTGRCDLSQLAVDYNALDRDEKQFYIDMAKGAKNQLTKLRPGEGAFGFRSRDLLRQQRVASRAAAPDAVRPCQGGADQEPMSRRRAAHGAVSAVARRSANRSLHELVMAAKAEQRRLMQLSGRTRAADRQALREWASTKGFALLEE
eukprot:8291385-Pyramimonas_sp.AAC.1